MTDNALQHTRQNDFAMWYQDVIAAAELAENSCVRGCMIIKPYGYAIWENMQLILDKEFKRTGHHNAYFPLLIPLSLLQKEAEHVDGFAKECAVVTHHKLTVKNGELLPDGELEEPLIIRPTSETIIAMYFAKWIKSYRDLPLLINQWANVMRWEMRPRLFLRTSEFLWQEGHTAHITSQEAQLEAKQMIDVYENFLVNTLAIPVIKGDKPIFERFPGAIDTHSVEIMTQDCKALQAGTSHFLGQNFAKASDIQFVDKDMQTKYVWTTSWGVSTRLIGGLIMVHSDDNGLILPPKIAPVQIVILPIIRDNSEKVLTYCEQIKTIIESSTFDNVPIRVTLDKRDMRGGEKSWQWIKKGAPIRIEIGERDINNQIITIAKRISSGPKYTIPLIDLLKSISDILSETHNELLSRAERFMKLNTHNIDNLEQFQAFFKENNGFAICYAINDTCIQEYIKPLQITARCILHESDMGNCIFTNKLNAKKMLFARAY